MWAAATWFSLSSASGGRDEAFVSNCYLSTTLVNAPENMAARLVFEQLVSLEVANLMFEFINDPSLDSATGKCDVHRADETLALCLAFATTGPG
jgi:hypothetical protein